MKNSMPLLSQTTLLSLILFLSLNTGCSTNQLTGKKVFNAFPNSQLFPMAIQQYNGFLKNNKVLKGSKSLEVKAIGERIANAAQKYFAFKGAPNHLKDYQREYNL
ncbi:MAG: M48 family peptidase, partial [Flavobacteriaceae bacterium]